MMPLTYAWVIRRYFSDFRTVLDIASGNGEFMANVNFDKRYEVTGVELFDPYIDNAKSLGVYKEIVKQDVREIAFEERSFDVVHASQLVEHLKHEETLALIAKMEKIARRVVVVGTPNGHYDQDEYDGNVLQRHQSEWTYQDFRKLGYTVYGQGLKYIYGEHGLLFSPLGKIPGIRQVLYIISYSAAPVVFFFPQLAAQIIAVKRV
jgi:2-polyprenyl-3-methyl-5-hydroxy-6-metoxy-1,4-benzoquinol methylase